MDPVTEVLVEAKRILEEDVEWHQGDLYKFSDGNNKVIVGACAIGAIEMATCSIYGLQADQNIGEVWEYAGPAERRVSMLLDETYEDNIPGFNDDTSTTKEDVLLLFKQAIEEESE